jgi:hypothetical protein
MAQSTGILKIEGTIEDLTFYKQNGRNFVRRKGGISRERIASDSNFVRTRENNTEFAHSGITAKQLRLALGSLVFKAKDSRLASRMLQVMSRIKNLDATSARGQRTVANGLTTLEGKLLLKGFDFNANAPLKSVLFAPYELDFPNGKLGFTDFITAEQLQFPQGATHLSLQCAALAIDFTTEFSEVAYSGIENLPINLVPNTFNLTTTSVPAGGTSQLFLLMVSFYQEVNGVQYSLKNEEYNVLHVLEVV